MIKRLIDSQDHANLVKNSQKYEKIKPKYDKLKLKAKELKSQVKDKDNIISKQNELISRKNKKLQEIQGTDQNQVDSVNNISVSKDIESTNIPNNNNPLPQQQNYYRKEKKSFFDKILEKLNDIFD